MEKIAIIGRVGIKEGLLKKGVSVVEKIIIDTPFGKSVPIYKMKYKGIEFFALSRHGERRYEISAPFVNYRANIWALKELCVGQIISLSSPGSLKEEIIPGTFAIPDDVIDETKNRQYTFFSGKGIGFIRANPAFCEELRAIAKRTIEELGLPLHFGGTYICTEGPRLETKAEIKKFIAFGGDFLGMTLCPEVFLARELELCYVSICVISNICEGIRDVPFCSFELFQGLLLEDEKEMLKRSEELKYDLMLSLVKKVSKRERNCICKDLMNFYKIRGDIGKDFREWIK